MRIDQFREFSEYLHDLVGSLTAGCHDYDICLSLLCDRMLENGLSATERTGDETCTAFGDRIEGIYDLTPVSMILCGLGFSLYAFTATFTGHFWVMFTDISSPSSPVSTAISVSTL